MNFIISGKNIDVTPGLKSCIEQKLGKLERYFTPETEIIVTLSVEKERQKIEVTIPVKGHIIRSEQSSNDMYVSIDLVEEVIERQLRKYKNKLVARTSSKNFLNQKILLQRMMRLRSSVQNDLESNQCSLRMRVSRWIYLDMISTYSSTQRQKKSMLYTRERMVLSV